MWENEAFVMYPHQFIQYNKQKDKSGTSHHFHWELGSKTSQTPKSADAQKCCGTYTQPTHILLNTLNHVKMTYNAKYNFDAWEE